MTYRCVSLILPVRDQSEHIEHALSAYDRALAALPIAYELLVVPNGCSDTSPAICEAVAARSPAIRVIHSERPGWGRAIRLGLDAAQGDLIGYTNSARTDPDELHRIVRHAIANPDTVVTAVRQRRERLVRTLGSYLFNLECRLALGVRSRDVNATPKLFPRSFQRLFEIARDDDLFDAAFHAECRAARYPISSVPIWSTRRHGGRSTSNWRTALRLCAGVLRLPKPTPAHRSQDAGRE